MWLILLLFIISCTSTSVYPKQNNSSQQNLPLFDVKIVYIDNHFDYKEKYLIQNALASWSYATKNMVIYDSKYIDLDDQFNDELNDISFAKGLPQKRSLQSSDVLYIIKRKSTDILALKAQNFINKARAPKDHLVIAGIEFTWKQNDIILLIVDKISDRGTVFNATAAHEIAHALLPTSPHINDVPSILNEYPANGPKCITKVDVQQFCSIYKCDWHQLNYCSK